MTSSGTPFLSVVIPAFNEDKRIIPTLEKVVHFLEGQGYIWEVVVSNDGSTDSTQSLVQAFSGDHPGVRAINLPHKGKGWAVQQGMLAAKGTYRFFCDADLSMPIEFLPPFLPPQLDAFHLAIASRELPGSHRIGEPFQRHLMGRAFNLLARIAGVRHISDTQCGFKCFSADAALSLFPLQKLTGFAFDVELLYLAQRKGFKIVEVPIDWYYNPQSKIHPLRDTIGMTRELLKIRWDSLRGRYK